MKAIIFKQTNLGILKRTSFRLLVLILLILIMPFMSGCVDDLDFEGFNPPPVPPQPFFNPGTIVADSVGYGSTDSIVLYGHFIPKEKKITVVEYRFNISASESYSLLIAKNEVWEFLKLDTVIISKVTIPAVLENATFRLTLEVKNPYYNQAVDPMGYQTNFFVSNSIPIKPKGTY